jgi:RNA polymerase sigma-70 factor (ECF subfamily)
MNHADQIHAAAAEAATHRDYLYRFAIKKVQDPDLADDLVQDTLLAAIQSSGAASAFGGRSTFRVWLTGILKHKIIDAYRDRSRTVSMTLESDDGEGDYEATQQAGDDTADSLHCQPQNVAETRQLLFHVDAALREMPSGIAEVFTAREIDGESTAELGQRLGISEANVWVRVHRARKALQQHLRASGVLDGFVGGRMAVA